MASAPDAAEALPRPEAKRAARRLHLSQPTLVALGALVLAVLALAAMMMVWGGGADDGAARATAEARMQAQAQALAAREALSTLPGTPGAGALDAMAGLQAALAQAAEADAARAAQLDRQRRVVLGLAAAALAAAALLGAAALAMRRQRQALRSALRQASSDLGSGAWQGALRTLSDDRLGAPSAFDALATGVEEVLGASERRWRTLADLAADWYWETDAGHRLAWMSGAGPLEALPGLRVENLLGRRHDEIEAFEAPGDGWARLHAVLEARRAFRGMEFRVRVAGRPDTVLWLAISGRPRTDAQGRFAGYEGVGRDVTERKRAHEQLRASDQRWALMAGLASDYYWETDTEHRILPLRPEIARRFGVMAEHSEGRTPWEAFPDAMTPQQWADYRADIAERRPYRGVEMQIDLPDGRQRIVATSGVPRFDGEGRFLGYHGIGRDITMRREAERLMLRHNETLQRAVAERTTELERMNRDLEAFARELAHELRTPIGHVQGLATLLVTKAGDRLAAEELQLIGLQLHAARHMRETVDGLLMLARSAVQAMVFEPVDVSAMARDIAGALPLHDGQAPVDWHIAPGLRAQAAPAALRIVLTNLLSNAVKFTRDVAEPCIRLTGRTDDDGRLRLRVEDNGAGFDMAQADRLFKPFARLHAEADYPGTGIGLTIVQRIIERHGGRVDARGAPGQGAWFEFTLAAAEGH